MASHIPPDHSRQAASFNWREHLPVHKLADEYPKVPHDRLIEIGESIRRSGLEFPILINAKGDPGNPEVFELFDGVTRLNSMVAVGIKFEFERSRCPRRSSLGKYSLRLVIHGVPINPNLLNAVKIFHNLSDAEIADKIEIANLHRRDLEPEQYRARIEASHARIEAALKRDPEKSDRAHAEELGVSGKTIAKVRKSTAEGSAVEGKRVGKDGKARKRSVRKPKAPAAPSQAILDAEASAAARKAQHAAEEAQLNNVVRGVNFSKPETATETAPEVPAKRKRVVVIELNPATFADAPQPTQTSFLAWIGVKTVLAALPLEWLEDVRAWVAAHDATASAPAAPSNSDDLNIPSYLRRDPSRRLN